MKVIVKPGYYEICIFPYQEGDKEETFEGCLYIFYGRSNVFESLEECLNYLDFIKFDDHVNIHISLEDELNNYFSSLDIEYRYSKNKQFILY